ncbi:MAG TPA: hypothetical protein VEA18_01780 [Candidatus Kapabacteria bacterium]|nr:hypothetical protein [Candidatus Kapabacteria bacterium]
MLQEFQPTSERLSTGSRNLIQMRLIQESGMDPLEWIAQYSERLADIVDDQPEDSEDVRKQKQAWRKLYAEHQDEAIAVLKERLNK